MPKGVRGELRDPVQSDQSALAEEEMESLDMKKADQVSFKPIPLDAAKTRRPFDGYPLKKFTFGKVNTYESYIVAINPSIPIYQDPANKRVKQRNGTMKKVLTRHSRVIRDREINENLIIVFDRDIESNGVNYQCAIVESHNVRAQICFAYDANRKRITVDPRYELLDTEQRGRLRQVYEQVINPKIKMEKQAAFITGETEEDSGEVGLTPE
jgi:hypothetical protein